MVNIFKICAFYIFLYSHDLNIRIQRVTQRDGITADEVKSRNDRQFSEEKKLGMANDVIINDDTQLVIPQVIKLHELYLSLAETK
jgi:dephospho-CoA kinase